MLEETANPFKLERRWLWWTYSQDSVRTSPSSEAELILCLKCSPAVVGCWCWSAFQASFPRLRPGLQKQSIMSISTQLARLRAEGKAHPSTKTVPSILFENKQASALHLEDVQGLGRNGLQALSSISSEFLQYEAILRLDSHGRGPIQMLDRSLLAPEEEQILSEGITGVCRLLCGVWMLRPAQKVCEWLVRGLRVDQYGSEDQLDALVIMALPYHATKEFVRWIRCVLGATLEFKCCEKVEMVETMCEPEQTD